MVFKKYTSICFQPRKNNMFRASLDESTRTYIVNSLSSVFSLETDSVHVHIAINTQRKLV